MKPKQHLTPSFVPVIDTIHVFAAENPSVKMSVVAIMTQAIIDLLDQPPTCVSILRTATDRKSSATDGAPVVQSITASALYKESA